MNKWLKKWRESLNKELRQLYIVKYVLFIFAITYLVLGLNNIAFMALSLCCFWGVMLTEEQIKEEKKNNNKNNEK